MADRKPTIGDIATLYGRVKGKKSTAVLISDFDTDATPPAISAVSTTTDLSVSTTWALGLRIAFSTGALESPVFDEVTHDLMELGTARGRQHEIDRMATGTASFRLRNTSGNYWPDNASGAYAGEILPGKRVEIVAVYGGTTYGIFAGFVEMYAHGFEGGMGDDSAAIVDLTCADGLKLLALAQISSGSESAEASGTRIGNVLDLVSWPSDDRDLDAGQSTIIAKTFSGDNALDHIQSVTDTELGTLQVDGFGTMVFDDRHARFIDTVKTTSQATYGDDGGELPYQEAVWEYDDQRIFNDILITRSGGSEQSASDSDSQTAYGLRTLRRTGLLMADDNEAAEQANFLLGRFKDAEFRVRSITVMPQRDEANLWADALGFDFGTRITVRLNSSSVDKAYHIEGVEHEFSGSDNIWTTVWTLSPADGAAYWILDTSTLGTGTFVTKLAY